MKEMQEANTELPMKLIFVRRFDELISRQQKSPNICGIRRRVRPKLERCF